MLVLKPMKNYKMLSATFKTLILFIVRSNRIRHKLQKPLLIRMKSIFKRADFFCCWEQRKLLKCWEPLLKFDFTQIMSEDFCILMKLDLTIENKILVVQ